jgi:hypothetical protein
MIIKEGICLIGAVCESLTKDAMKGICGKHQGYKVRTRKMFEMNIITDKLKEKLDELWDYRGREHLFLLQDWEYGKYKLANYNDAIRTLRKLTDALDSYFWEKEMPF